ncbi:hypothetical protein ANO11243_018960 [Dothideomycetidae sp. 11243]|nr:hypothetical protein ANO11243_018960 [fungal sp. No.11243]
MVLEDLRLIHEDNERLEQAIAERYLDDPKLIRERLARDHQIASFLERMRTQSIRAKDIYADAAGEKLQEIQSISTGDAFTEFNKRLDDIKAFHKRYPNQPTENLERAYKRRAVGEDAPFPAEIDRMFTGEEAHGRYFDMLSLHDQYINLSGVKRRPTYLQYLDTFDDLVGFPRAEKMKEPYFRYLTGVAQYLEGFMRRVKPLENLDKLFSTYDKEFDEAWEAEKVPGWEKEATNGTKSDGPATQGSGEGIWCRDCEKEFSNEGVFKGHLTGKKHLRAVEARKARGETSTNGTNGASAKDPGLARLKDKAIAEREFRIKKLATAMKMERSDTKDNVNRKQGRTDKERAQELEALYNEDDGGSGAAVEGADDDDEERKANPKHLPLAWDGKPIPYWLYKLHGLGNEFPCEICGNYYYKGRRAFEKHFSEARHLYGLKCLGITTSSLFREITGINEAVSLWEEVKRDKKSEATNTNDVVQMEDSQGNVMPLKIWNDLSKAGLL